MKAFKLGEYKSLNKDEIDQKCYEKYKNRHFFIENKDTSVKKTNVIKNDEYTKANIYVRDVSENSYRYIYEKSSVFFKIYEAKYIVHDFSDIISFISLWQYLKLKALIIELPRTLGQDDFSLCTDIVSPYNYKYRARGVVDIDNQNLSRIDDLEDGTQIKENEQGRDYKEFLDWNFVFNNEKMARIYDYLSLKIYSAPELQNYVQNGFVTESEKKEGLNMRIAFAGVIIAVLTSIFSLIGNFSSSELKNIQIELEGIKQELMEMNVE